MRNLLSVLKRVPAAQAAEIRRLSNARLREKVARIVLEDGLTAVQTRQLVNGMLNLKDFPPKPS